MVLKSPKVSCHMKDMAEQPNANGEQIAEDSSLAWHEAPGFKQCLVHGRPSVFCQK